MKKSGIAIIVLIALILLFAFLITNMLRANTAQRFRIEYRQSSSMMKFIIFYDMETKERYLYIRDQMGGSGITKM